MQDLNVALVQCPLHWENRDANLQAFAERLSELKATPDLVVLPEMFSTSFSMNGGKCAEEDGGPAHEWLQKKAAGMQCVIACSLMVREKGKLFNRFVWMRPDGTYAKYDKRHLFRFVGEHEHSSPGKAGNSALWFAMTCASRSGV
jgi:omega-amidase